MQKTCEKPDTIHYILSRSYSLYLFSIIAGVIIDTVIYRLKFSFPFYSEIGFFIMFIGSVVVYWSQQSSSRSKREFKKNPGSKRNFARGPYKYSRNPTHIGLMIASLGFGVLAGSFFIIMFILFAFVTSLLVFLPKEEALLAKKYGQDYIDYQKKVHPWI